ARTLATAAAGRHRAPPRPHAARRPGQFGPRPGAAHASLEFLQSSLSRGPPPMADDSESDSPELQKAKTFFQYGNDAAQKSNFDYAINMYREACKLVPDNMVYRQSLRGAQRRKFNGNPAKVGKLVGVRNQPILMQAKSARSKGRHPEALDLCEAAFINNPWDVGAARVAAEAAEQMGLGALAQWYVDSVQTVAKDAEFFRFAAHIHELNESWQKAI